jgi:hypothetical protein
MLYAYFTQTRQGAKVFCESFEKRKKGKKWF